MTGVPSDWRPRSGLYVRYRGREVLRLGIVGVPGTPSERWPLDVEEPTTVRPGDTDGRLSIRTLAKVGDDTVDVYAADGVTARCRVDGYPEWAAVLGGAYDRNDAGTIVEVPLLDLHDLVEAVRTYPDGKPVMRPIRFDAEDGPSS